jgi:deoxyribodipyrimidine photolyase
MANQLTPLSYSIIELEIALMNIFKGMIDLIQVVNSAGDLAIELNDVITDKEQFYKLFQRYNDNLKKLLEDPETYVIEEPEENVVIEEPKPKPKRTYKRKPKI